MIYIGQVKTNRIRRALSSSIWMLGEIGSTRFTKHQEVEK